MIKICFVSAFFALFCYGLVWVVLVYLFVFFWFSLVCSDLCRFGLVWADLFCLFWFILVCIGLIWFVSVIFSIGQYVIKTKGR